MPINHNILHIIVVKCLQLVKQKMIPFEKIWCYSYCGSTLRFYDEDINIVLADNDDEALLKIFLTNTKDIQLDFLCRYNFTKKKIKLNYIKPIYPQLLQYYGHDVNHVIIEFMRSLHKDQRLHIHQQPSIT